MCGVCDSNLVLAFRVDQNTVKVLYKNKLRGFEFCVEWSNLDLDGVTLPTYSLTCNILVGGDVSLSELLLSCIYTNEDKYIKWWLDSFIDVGSVSIRHVAIFKMLTSSWSSVQCEGVN